MLNQGGRGGAKGKSGLRKMRGRAVPGGAGMGWAGQERTGHDRAEQSRGKDRAEKGCSLIVYLNFSASLFFVIWHLLLVRQWPYQFRKHFLKI